MTETTKATRLLHPREETRELLGISHSMLIRLERRGVLKPIKLTKSPTGKVFHTDANVRAVAAGLIEPSDD